MLPRVHSLSPQTAEFDAQLTAAGAAIDQAGVAALYCIHGTFVGNDFFGLNTELSRFVPPLAKLLSRSGKRIVDLFTGEAGNYTRKFAATLEEKLAAGASRTIPVRLFHWSSQNNHIARADGAIRLLAELARCAEELDTTQPRRVLLWGHSHGGNVMALASQLLAADRAARDQFFATTKSFYHAWIRRSVDMPVWQRVQSLLDDDTHPLRQLSLDMVTFGTPVRYGWNERGYANLLHFTHHRPPLQGAEYQAPVPLKLLRALKARDGDYVQQIGIAGTNFPPFPFAVRTFLADRRLDGLLEREVDRESILARLHRGVRVPDEGTTLLVDYADIHPRVYRHIAGHGLYTRRQWLPFHCREIANRFYGSD